MSGDKLQNLRDQIDSINEEIYDLIKKRTEIVGEVGAYKAENMPEIKTIMKPSREYKMVLDIYQRAVKDGYEDKIALAIANLWRGLITLSINYEEDSSVGVLSSDLDSKYLAREYFGFFTKVSQFNNINELFNSLVKDEVKVCVFSIEESREVDDLIFQHNDSSEKSEQISKFVSLPFFDVELKGESPKSFAIAKVVE